MSRNSLIKKGLVLGIIVLFICSGFFTIPAITNDDLPDLEVVNIIAPDTAVEGDNITVNVTIENSGSGDVPVGTAIEVGLFIDNEYNPISTNVTYDGFSNNTFRHFNLYWIAEVGNHSLHVIVDYNNQIVESNETNNEKVKFIDVFGGPLLVYVDDDFNESTPYWNVTCFDNIQDGIDAVNESGTVYVYNGTYYENVVIDKSINLIGESKEHTIIDGRNAEKDIITISYDFINIINFTMQNSLINCHGIYIISSDNITIKNCLLYNIGSYGFELDRVQNCLILNTEINKCGIGIHLIYSTNNTISNNTIYDIGNHGIGVYAKSDNNLFSHNYLYIRL